MSGLQLIFKGFSQKKQREKREGGKEPTREGGRKEGEKKRDGGGREGIWRESNMQI